MSERAIKKKIALLKADTENSFIDNVSAKKNYVKDSGQLIEAFGNVADWTVTGCTAAANTTQYKEGSQSLELTSSAANTTMQVDKTVNLDLSDLETFSIWVSTDDPAGFANYLTIFLSNDNFANYFQFSRPASYYLRAGEWHLYTIKKSEFTIGGGAPSWNNAITRIRITVKSAAAKTPKLILGGMYKNIAGIPRVLFVADDAHQSVYNVMYKYLKSRGKPMTFYLATDYVNTPTNVTLDMVKEMYANGCDIGNHTSSHTDLTTITIKQARDIVMKAKKQLDTWGFDRASDHIAFPFGGINADIIKMCKDYNFKTGRIVGNIMTQFIPVDDPLRLRCCQIINSTPVENATIEADRARDYGHTLIYLFHQFSDTYNASNTSVYETAKFKRIVDHCIDIGLPFSTISRWHWGRQNAKIV